MGWKYIMLDKGLFQFPIIFPDKLVHQEVFTMTRHLVPPQNDEYSRVVSAGMINQLFAKGVNGESETLRIKSRKIDERIINMYNYEHGIKGL